MTQPLLLGRDFTGSSVKIFETNKFICFSTQPPTSGPSDLHSSNYIDVPIHSEVRKALPLSVLQITTIPPFTTAVVQCRVKETSNLSDGSAPNNLELFEVDTIFHPNLQSVDALLLLEDRNNVSIPIYNASSEEIELSSDTQIGKIFLHKNPLQIFP